MSYGRHHRDVFIDKDITFNQNLVFRKKRSDRIIKYIDMKVSLIT
jgi:hypothetical protein